MSIIIIIITIYYHCNLSVHTTAPYIIVGYQHKIIIAIIILIILILQPSTHHHHHIHTIPHTITLSRIVMNLLTTPTRVYDVADMRSRQSHPV